MTILDGIPVADASLEVGSDAGEWGTTVTVQLRLDNAIPGMAIQTLAGKAVRRLKSVVETGEAPRTDHTPSARSDAGEQSQSARCAGCT